MKLTDLKCPRCSGLLNQQCDKFYCSSCGAAFEVDYEDTDVEYSRLLTEADRTRMMIERDKEVLKKDFEFREAYKDEEARRKAQYEIQKRTRTAVSALVTTVITFSMMFILMIGLIVYIITVVAAPSRIESKLRGKDEAEARTLSAEQILADPNFIYNASADGIWFRSGELFEPYVTEIYGEERTCEIVGLPTPVAAYITSETQEFGGRDYTRNKFYVAYRATYRMTDTDEDETVDIYTYAEFDNVEKKPNGRIGFDPEHYGAVDINYHSYYELGQLEREHFDGAEKIDLSEIFGKGGEDA